VSRDGESPFFVDGRAWKSGGKGADDQMQRFAYYGAVAIAAVEVLAVGTCVWAIVRGRRYQPLGGEQMEGLRRG